MSNAVEHTDLEAEAGLALADAREFAITSPEKAQEAANELQNVHEMKKRIVDHFEPMRKTSYEAYQAVLTSKAEYLRPLETAEKILKSKLGGWQAAQDALREAEMKAAQEKAEAEARAKREAEAKAMQDQAAAAKRAGDVQQAAELRTAAKELKAAPVVVAVDAVAPVVKPTGVSTTYSYDFEIDNVALIPREYMVPDEVAIRRVVKALKEKTNIPGLRVVRKPMVSVR